MEYDWFYLEGLDTSFTFRASQSPYGDTTDAVNHAAPNSVNGSPFRVTGSCVSSYGPSWYKDPGLCTGTTLFGSTFWYTLGKLNTVRMMVRLVQ
jgi:hypothetical protein